MPEMEKRVKNNFYGTVNCEFMCSSSHFFFIKIILPPQVTSVLFGQRALSWEMKIGKLFCITGSVYTINYKVNNENNKFQFIWELRKQKEEVNRQKILRDGVYTYNAPLMYEVNTTYTDV